MREEEATYYSVARDGRVFHHEDRSTIQENRSTVSRTSKYALAPVEPRRRQVYHSASFQVHNEAQDQVTDNHPDMPSPELRETFVRLQDKVAALSGFPVRHQEPVQVVHYYPVGITRAFSGQSVDANVRRAKGAM